MILVDTSSWVEFDRKTGSPAHLRVRDLLPERTELAVTDPVIAEVLMGARNEEREAALRRFMAGFCQLPFQTPGDCDGAVSIYRKCRANSITPRGLIDCMIASVAIRNDVPVLSHDKDMARIASVTSMKLDGASLQP